MTVRSGRADGRVLRAYATEPVFADSLNRAANAPVLTVLLCTVAVPSPPTVTLVHAENEPLSNPSLKSVEPPCRSMVQVRLAGLGSVLPAGSVARTVNVCEPSASPL